MIYMQKRGQVTIFIIIAIVVVVAGSMFFVFKDSFSNNNQDVPVEIAPIKNFVDDCIENSIEDVVYQIGQGGGYYFPPVLADEWGYTYYFYEGKEYFPSLTQIESEFSQLMESEIALCSGNFEDFEQYNIDQKSVVVDTEIYDERIVFEVRYPLRINYREDSYVLKDFGTHSYDVRLGKIHSRVYEMIEEDYYSEEGICLSCFSEMMLIDGFDINYLKGEAGGSLFSILDYNKDYNRTFEYIFAG